MEPPPPPTFRQCSTESSGSGESASSTTNTSAGSSAGYPASDIPLASAPPVLASAAALAAALTHQALPPFFQHLARGEVQPAIQALLALKGGRGGAGAGAGAAAAAAGGQLDVLDNVLSPFLLLAAAEKMSVSFGGLIDRHTGPFQTSNPSIPSHSNAHRPPQAPFGRQQLRGQRGEELPGPAAHVPRCEQRRFSSPPPLWQKQQQEQQQQ